MNATAFLMLSWLGLLPALSPPTDSPASGSKPVTFTGKVAMLADALKGRDVAFDAEPLANQAVLIGDDGTITPLLSNDASRALFQDEHLRNRRAELTGSLVRGSPYLQVVSFRVEDHGKLRTPEYYCEICSISVRYPMICYCCQGPMVLRMQPEAP
jgi:hypothetical protein